MPSVAENPLVLLIAAFVLLCIVGTVRSVFPDKPRKWLFLLPLGLALIGLGLDFFIQTDNEKVRVTLKAVMKSLEDEDIETFKSWIAPDYQDSLHKSKIRLLQHAEDGLTRSPLAQAKIPHLSVPDVQGEQTKAFITTYLTFTPESYVAQHYKALVIVEVEFHLRKQADGRWLVNRIEVVEVDKQPVQWTQVQGHF